MAVLNPSLRVVVVIEKMPALDARPVKLWPPMVIVTRLLASAVPVRVMIAPEIEAPELGAVMTGTPGAAVSILKFDVLVGDTLEALSVKNTLAT